MISLHYQLCSLILQKNITKIISFIYGCIIQLLKKFPVKIMNLRQPKKPTFQMNLLRLNHRSMFHQKPSFNKKIIESRFNLNSYQMKNKRKYNILTKQSYSAYLAELKKQVQGSSFVVKGYSLKSNEENSSKFMIQSFQDGKKLKNGDQGSRGEQTTIISEYLVPNYVEQFCRRDKTYKRDRNIFLRSSQKNNIYQKQDTQQSQLSQRYRSYYKQSSSMSQLCNHQSKKANKLFKAQTISQRALNILHKQKYIFSKRADPSKTINKKESSSNLFQDKNIFQQISKNCINLKENKLKQSEDRNKHTNRNKEEMDESTKNTIKDVWSILTAKIHPFQNSITFPRRRTYISYSKSTITQF